MIENIKYEYSVMVCPTNEPENLENMLNNKAREGWELYSINESESSSGRTQYNCIFYREFNAAQAESKKIVDISDFRSKMEKILHPSDEPYEECKEVQGKINQKQEEISRIKDLLDSTSSGINHKKLNEEISKNLEELTELNNKFAEIIDANRMYGRINQDKLTIVVSDELLDLIDINKNGQLISETVRLRQKLTDNLGYIIPSIHFTNSEILEANEYRIDIRGIKTFSGTVNPGYVRFYLGQSNISKKPKGAILDTDPISGKQVFWIEESKTKNFWEKGMSPAQVIVHNLEYIVRKYANEIFDYNDIINYIEIVNNQNPYLVENLVPEYLTVSDIRNIFTILIREKVSIKDVVYIFERLNDIIQYVPEKENILEKLRISLSRQICSSIVDAYNNIYGIVISEELAETLENLLANEENYKELLLSLSENNIIKKLINKVEYIVNNTEFGNIALIAPPSIRLKLFLLFEHIIPDLSVISNCEITGGYNLEIIDNLANF